ncbi:MAG: hypothetical protein NVSMB30_13650 [Hymenobacter sp.]
MPDSSPTVTLDGYPRRRRWQHPHLTEAVALRERLLAAYPQFAAKNPSSIHNACRCELLKELTPPVPTTPAPGPAQVSVQQSAGGVVIDFPASQSVKTLGELLAATDFNPLEWEVEKHIVNKWDTHAVLDGAPVCLTNWQVKAWLKPIERLTTLTVEEMAKTLAPLVKRTGAFFRPKQPINSGDYLLELDIFDLHLGKLADPLETGQEYNLEIACALYEAAVDALLARAAGYPIGEVLIPVGNDFYNSDTKIGSTTAGTPQHEAARWQRTFVRGGALIIATANRIRERGLKVRLVMVPGNHDECNVFYLGQVLGATFAECSDVTIDNTFSTRKYVQFHDCGIMYTHGNAEKEANLAQIFAQEQPAMWAATRFRETHLAHVHHKKEFKYRTMGEQIGMTTRYMRSLSAVDAWHHWKGYVGSQRSAEGFVWARGEGVVAHLTYTYSGQQLHRAA